MSEGPFKPEDFNTTEAHAGLAWPQGCMAHIANSHPFVKEAKELLELIKSHGCGVCMSDDEASEFLYKWFTEEKK